MYKYRVISQISRVENEICQNTNFPEDEMIQMFYHFGIIIINYLVSL